MIQCNTQVYLLLNFACKHKLEKGLRKKFYLSTGNFWLTENENEERAFSFCLKSIFLLHSKYVFIRITKAGIRKMTIKEVSMLI